MPRARWRELADLNEADSLGFARTPVNQRRGKRWSSADGYLGEAKGRRNLTIVTGATTRRVVFEGTRAAGVEYADVRGAVKVARGREVLLCAGAIGSPQLLLLSGLGLAASLRSIEILSWRRSSRGREAEDHLVAVEGLHSPEPFSPSKPRPSTTPSALAAWAATTHRSSTPSCASAASRVCASSSRR